MNVCDLRILFKKIIITLVIFERVGVKTLYR